MKKNKLKTQERELFAVSLDLEMIAFKLGLINEDLEEQEEAELITETNRARGLVRECIRAVDALRRKCL